MRQRRVLWLSLALALASCGDKTAPPPPPPLPPGPAAQPSPGLPARPRPARERVRIETPTPDPVRLEEDPVLAPKTTPKPREAGHLLESVAFKNEEEVLAALGQPSERWVHDGRESWYYAEPARNRQGRPACPEVIFEDAEARMVVFWAPEVMRDKISFARAHKDQAPAKAPASFAFADAFHSLGVGTEAAIVLRDLGPPDRRRAGPEGREDWDYEAMVVENGVERLLTVGIRDGKVVSVQGQ